MKKEKKPTLKFLMLIVAILATICISLATDPIEKKSCSDFKCPGKATCPNGVKGFQSCDYIECKDGSGILCFEEG